NGVSDGTDASDGAIVLSNAGGTEIRGTIIASNMFGSTNGGGNLNDIVLTGSGAVNSHTGITATHIVGNQSDFASHRFLYINAANKTSVVGNRVNDPSQ